MPEGSIDYQVVLFTHHHSITGEMVLKDRRLSDHINERVDTMLNLRNVTVARLENPARVLHKMNAAVIPKAAIVVIFEPPQNAIPPSNRFFGYIKKDKHNVFLILDGMEVHGVLHTQNNPDIKRVLVNSPDAFLPITQASIRLDINPALNINQDAILINTQRVRLVGKLELDSQPSPLPPLNPSTP